MPRITGKVLIHQNDTSKPLPGILVGVLSASAPHPDVAAKTNAAGDYTLDGLAPGTYVIGAAGAQAKTTVAAQDEEVACDIIAENPSRGFTVDPAAQAPEMAETALVDESDAPEAFMDDPTARETPVPVEETADLSTFDRGLIYAVLSLRLAAGMRDRDVLTDAAYQVVHPDEQLPFSGDDPALAEKSRVWLDLRKEIVDPLLGNADSPAAPQAQTAEAFGIATQRIPDGAGYRVRRNGTNWGAPRMIAAIQAIGQAWEMRHPEVDLWVLDMSKQAGGPVGRHKSHQCFFDVDIQLRLGQKKLCMTRSRYPEWRSLWQDLADLVHANGALPVKVIGFSDAAVSGVSNWVGHHCHFHVRFCAPPDQIDAVEDAVAGLYADKPRNKRPKYRCRNGAFEAASAPPNLGPSPELFPIDYLDAEQQSEEAGTRGISFVQRGFAYAAIALAYARGTRTADKLTDAGWQAVFPDAPFPLQPWHDGFAAKRDTWVETRKMVDGFLATIQSDRRPVPAAPAVCVNGGHTLLRRLVDRAEEAGAPKGFATFAEGAAWTESRWNNCAVNDTRNEAAAALRLYEGALGRGWFPDNPYGPDDFGFGSAGWFGLMPSSGLIAGGNRGPFINANPQLVKDPAASVVMIADFAVRLIRKYPVRHWLDVRRGMASLKLIGPRGDGRTRARQTQERFETGLIRAGITTPEAFMMRKPNADDYPGAWALWRALAD